MTNGLCRTIGLVAVVLLAGGMLKKQSAFSGERSVENSPRFRGDNGTGISEQKGFPTTWSPGDYAWNIELPGVGHSSPVIWDDHLFVTSAVDQGAVRFLICLDAETGREKWRHVVGFNKSHKHQFNSWASNTPATDGERVYFTLSDDERFTLAAYDFDGNLLWRRVLGGFESQHGHGISPIVFENMLILPKLQYGPSYVMAFDKRTGETLWSTPLDFIRTSYATPIVIKPDGGDPQLICASGGQGLVSIDPVNGRKIWWTGPFPPPKQRTVASPVFGGGLVFQSCGGGGVGEVLIGVDPSGHGDVSKTHVKFRRDRQLPYVPTPIIYQGHLYLWGDHGVVSCVEIETGRNVWTKRLASTEYFGSPLCIDGKLYAVDMEGVVTVIAASPEYHFFGRTPLGDPSHTTPVVANGRLYLRSFHRLACLEARP